MLKAHFPHEKDVPTTLGLEIDLSKLLIFMTLPRAFVIFKNSAFGLDIKVVRS